MSNELKTKDTRKLGGSEIEVSALGVGVWAWGETSYWGYGTNYSRADIEAAYRASLDAGINFFDTAEIYGGGQSEKLLGEISAKEGRPIIIASKFAPLPIRFSATKLQEALSASLERLKLPQIDLYQIHWPYSILKIEALMDELAKAHKAGKIRAVGVSNYNVPQMRRAKAQLDKYGIPLASNQVQYNLLYRKPEANGVLAECRRLNVALIAYSPMAQGLLTSKFDVKMAEQLAGPRRFLPRFRQGSLAKMTPVIRTLQQIAAAHEKTVEQVALNWLLCKDELVIPIPGAKTAKQATANAGTLGWRLSPEEVKQLDNVSASYIK